MTPAEVLRKAAHVIRERGWFQGYYQKFAGGPVCVVGAINVAEGKAPDLMHEGGVGRAFFRAYVGNILGPWNDSPQRTAEEVIAALEKAAELAESK